MPEEGPRDIPVHVTKVLLATVRRPVFVAADVAAVMNRRHGEELVGEFMNRCAADAAADRLDQRRAVGVRRGICDRRVGDEEEAHRTLAANAGDGPGLAGDTDLPPEPGVAK